MFRTKKDLGQVYDYHKEELDLISVRPLSSNKISNSIDRSHSKVG